MSCVNSPLSNNLYLLFGYCGLKRGLCRRGHCVRHLTRCRLSQDFRAGRVHF